MIVLAIISFLGFLVSILVHIINLPGFAGVELPGLWLTALPLHIGVFVVLIPMMFVNPIVNVGSRSKTGWHNLMRPIPPHSRNWLKWLLVYVFISIITLMIVGWLSPSHGKLAISEQNYLLRSLELHAFSAAWIYFYLTGFMVYRFHSPLKDQEFWSNLFKGKNKWKRHHAKIEHQE